MIRYPTTFSRLLPYVLQLENILDQALIIGDKVGNVAQKKCCEEFRYLGKSRMHYEINYTIW